MLLHVVGLSMSAALHVQGLNVNYHSGPLIVIVARFHKLDLRSCNADLSLGMDAVFFLNCILMKLDIAAVLFVNCLQP